MRNLPLIRRALAQQGMISGRMAFALAAYLRFMKVEARPDVTFRGTVDGNEYEVQDEFSAFYADLWETHDDPKALVQKKFAREDLWGDDFGKSSTFIDAVADQLTLILKNGTLQALSQLSGQ
jgi:mannitol-1-phosphate/altronate dehydrogenase